MSAAAAFVRSWRVGQFTATLSVPRLEPGALSTEVAEYLAGRDRVFAELSKGLGLRTLVVGS